MGFLEYEATSNPRPQAESNTGKKLWVLFAARLNRPLARVGGIKRNTVYSLALRCSPRLHPYFIDRQKEIKGPLLDRLV